MKPNKHKKIDALLMHIVSAFVIFIENKGLAKQSTIVQFDDDQNNGTTQEYTHIFNAGCRSSTASVSNRRKTKKLDIY